MVAGPKAERPGSRGFCRRTAYGVVHLGARIEAGQTVLIELLRLVEEGALHLNVSAVLPLGEAAEAHRRLESRASVGKILLDMQG